MDHVTSCLIKTVRTFWQVKNDKIIGSELKVVAFETITNESLKFGSHLDLISLLFDQQWKNIFDAKNMKKKDLQESYFIPYKWSFLCLIYSDRIFWNENHDKSNGRKLYDDTFNMKLSKLALIWIFLLVLSALKGYFCYEKHGKNFWRVLFHLYEKNENIWVKLCTQN